MEYLNRKDYLNNERKRNADNTPSFEYNCGGYALQTFSWYKPYEFDSYDYIYELLAQGYSEEEITERILEVSRDNMEWDFGDKIRFIRTDYFSRENTQEELLNQLEENEELIAFRIGLEIDDCDYDNPVIVDYDFHYRVYRNGSWSEKMGNESITPCDFEEDYWDGFCIYDSPIYYFAMKVA